MRQTLRRWSIAFALAAGALLGLQPSGLLADDPAPAKTDDRPPAYVLPSPDDAPVPIRLRPDPLLDRPGAPPSGWFFNAEATFDFVHLRNQLTTPVRVSPTRTDTVDFPGNRLNDTVAPRFELGYRLPDGLGDVLVSYRFLVTDGSDTFANGLGPADQEGRLDLNVLDLRYVSREYSLEPNWEMRWSVGGRFAFLFFDSHANYLDAGMAAGSTLVQTDSNSFWSLGPMGGLELDRKIGSGGLAFFTRIEASGMYGRIKQIATEELAGPPDFAQTRTQSGVGLPTVGGTVGLSYTAPEWNHSRLLLGYQYEVWWQIGRVNDSRATLEDQGLFLRAEFNF